MRALIKERKKDNRDEFAWSMLGYISAVDCYRFITSSLVRLMPSLVFMQNYRQAHPFDNFRLGVQALVGELAR